MKKSVLSVLSAASLCTVLCLALAACGGPREVSNLAYSIEYEGNTLNGTYAGTIEEQLPNGEGTFTCTDDGITYTYTGTWESGSIAGEGTLDSNIYVVHFTDGTDRTGEYQGDTLDGLASGSGTFSATNDNGDSYTYTGEWANGLFSGNGKKVFQSDDYPIEEGNFSDGEFEPTPLEYFTARGTYEKKQYVITDQAADFLSAHPDVFLNNSTEGSDVEIISDFQYSAFSKNPSNFGDKLIKVSGLYVVQIFEDEYWDSPHAFMILDTNGGYGGNVYYVNMYGYADDVYEGSTVTLTALPLDYFTYPNVSDTAVWAIACAGVSVS